MATKNTNDYLDALIDATLDDQPLPRAEGEGDAEVRRHFEDTQAIFNSFRDLDLDPSSWQGDVWARVDADTSGESPPLEDVTEDVADAPHESSSGGQVIDARGRFGSKVAAVVTVLAMAAALLLMVDLHDQTTAPDTLQAPERAPSMAKDEAPSPVDAPTNHGLDQQAMAKLDERRAKKGTKTEEEKSTAIAKGDGNEDADKILEGHPVGDRDTDLEDDSAPQAFVAETPEEQAEEGSGAVPHKVPARGVGKKRGALGGKGQLGAADGKIAQRTITRKNLGSLDAEDTGRGGLAANERKEEDLAFNEPAQEPTAPTDDNMPGGLAAGGSGNRVGHSGGEAS